MKKSIKKIWNAIKTTQPKEGKVFPPIKFPLILFTKIDIINRLPKNIAEECFFCEGTENELPCGCCHTCRNLLSLELSYPFLEYKNLSFIKKHKEDASLEVEPEVIAIKKRLSLKKRLNSINIFIKSNSNSKNR